MLDIPTRTFSRSKGVHNVPLGALCDWVEASALFLDEEGVVDAAVVDALVESGIYADQAFAWERVTNGWSEMRRRSRCEGQDSGVEISQHSVRRRRGWEHFPAYSFCIILRLSELYPAWVAQFGSDYTEQGRLFEELTKASLETLLPTWQVHLTGWSRRRTNKLAVVVKEVASLLGEQVGNIRHWTKATANEAGLDLVCYRPFPDGRVGVPVYLVQCASGRNWDQKLHTPNLDLWKKIITFAASPRKGFATPFPLAEDDFPRKCTLVDGMVIDRHRLLSAGRHNRSWIPSSLRHDLIQWLGPRISALPRLA